MIRIDDAQDILDRAFLPMQSRYLMKAMLEEIVDTRHKHQNYSSEIDQLCQKVAEAEFDLNFHKELLEKSASKVKLKELTIENNELAAENLRLEIENGDLRNHIAIIRWRDEKVRADSLLIKLTELQGEISGKTVKKAPKRPKNEQIGPKSVKKAKKKAKTVKKAPKKAKMAPNARKRSGA